VPPEMPPLDVDSAEVLESPLRNKPRGANPWNSRWMGEFGVPQEAGKVHIDIQTTTPSQPGQPPHPQEGIRAARGGASGSAQFRATPT